jgi:tetratricopeptide (TPR) repeat protein
MDWQSIVEDLSKSGPAERRHNMRLGILAALLAIVAGIAYWTVARQHEQTRWVTGYREASDSYERMHYADAETQLRMLTLQAKQPDSYQSALAMNLLALVYHAQGRRTEAEPLFEKAIHIFEKDGPRARMDLAKACNNEGRVYLEENRLSEAEQRLQQALAIFQEEPAAAGAELGGALQNLGLVRRAQKRATQAQSLLEQAVQTFERTLSPLDLNLAQSYLDLADQYRSVGLLKNAQEMDQKALFIQEHAFGSESAVVKETRARIAYEAKSAPSVAGAPVIQPKEAALAKEKN